MSELTQKELISVLKYDGESGKFVWLIRASSRAKAGCAAGNIANNGYFVIKYLGRTYRAHRLAWLYVMGEFPSSDIDHINGDRLDNRWANLRVVAKVENSQNLRRATARSSTGLLGVYPSRGQFGARITVNGKRVFLGIHPTAEGAHSAYLEAKRRLHAGCTI